MNALAPQNNMANGSPVQVLEEYYSRDRMAQAKPVL
jgi:hypothetical protein